MLAQLSRAFFISALSLSVFSGPAFCQEIRVTLLGTGNPPPVMDRFGPSILVEAGDENFYLILVATRYSASRKSH